MSRRTSQTRVWVTGRVTYVWKSDTCASRCRYPRTYMCVYLSIRVFRSLASYSPSLPWNNILLTCLPETSYVSSLSGACSTHARNNPENSHTSSAEIGQISPPLCACLAGCAHPEVTAALCAPGMTRAPAVYGFCTEYSTWRGPLAYTGKSALFRHPHTGFWELRWEDEREKGGQKGFFSEKGLHGAE